MSMVINHHPIEQITFKEGNAFLIEASAGTGKTWTLERLYIKALLEATSQTNPGTAISVENILVVTFTNDAVEELKNRIYLHIKKTIDVLFDFYHQENNLAQNSSDVFYQYLEYRYKNHNINQDIVILTRALQRFDLAAIYTIHKFCSRVIKNYQFFFDVDFDGH
jgi:exodeoxyribonuclease V beta subunit